MKSDLTCPVEVVRVSIREEEPAQKPESGQEDGQIVCEIEFANLSEKETASIQMNIICFDADDARLGGRLVRATAEGEPRGRFTGVFMPEHVAGTARVEASVEKVWFKDGVVWRREERNVREYTPNQLPEGRELDRLRAVAGPDAAGYAREDDIVWMCVCGRANRTSDDRCMRCRRERAQVLEKYSFAAIDSTVGRKERTLEEQTKKNLQKSSEQTVREVSREQKKLKKRHRRVKLVIALLVVVAAGLALLRWGLPYGANRAAAWKLEQGLAADAKALYDWVDAYWPDFGGAHMLAQQAEQVIVEGLIGANTDETLAEAARRAQALETQDADALYEKAVIARAQLAWDRGDTAGAETLLDGMTDSQDAQEMLAALRYEIGRTAMNRLDYKTAIAYFGLLGEYGDAQSLRSECIYRYGRQLMREGKYEEASAQLMLVPDESDALALVRQCRYAIALAAQEDGDYEVAAEAFESLGVYEEAETRAKVCRYEAGMAALSVGDLEKAAAQLEKAEDYEDAAQRWSDAVFTLGSAALSEGRYAEAVAWLEKLERTRDVTEALNEAIYAYAQELEEKGMAEEAAIQYGAAGDYRDAASRANELVYAIAVSEMADAPASALSRFESLGSYCDAKDMANACRYAIAQQRYADAQYETAMALFEALGDYEDAQAQARRSCYAYAGQLYDDGQYAEAAAQYEACGAYLNAEDRAMRAHYEAAAALESAGEYEAAAEAFAALGSYEDAKLRVTQNEDSWLRSLYTSAQLDMGLGDYDSVIATLEGVWNGELPERYAAMRSMYEEACLTRADELIAANRPLDALPVLERIPDNATAKKRLDAYVYQIIGRWKDRNGREFTFRRDGSCTIDGEEMYFGGRNYDLYLGGEPYPTKAAYGIVSLKKGVLTIRSKETGKDTRLTYLGEPAEAAPEETVPEETAETGE